MIKSVKGDILLTQAQTIAHGVAPHDHFTSGLAQSLKEQCPAMYKDFRHFCQTHNPKPGTAWTWGGTGGKRIVALFSQDAPSGHHHQGHPGKAGLDHVNHALRELRHTVEKERLTSVALPRIATGVGGAFLGAGPSAGGKAPRRPRHPDLHLRGLPEGRRCSRVGVAPLAGHRRQARSCRLRA